MQNIQTKNKFDEIIEKMIAENINGIDDSLYNLEHTEKISNVFKTVDSTGSFSKLDLSKKPKMDHLKSVITMLKDYVKVGEVKKKEAGEVMTPLELVKEMLTTLPEDVWSNPNLKWLDSCNGSGPFLVMVIYKLMIGLKDWESDEEKRYKHIVENMIYAGELQPKNMFLFVSAIDPFDEYNLNIYTGSFLEKEFDIHMKTVWGLEKFSIILGNPPYNGAETGGGNSLWDKFIRKSIPIIIDSGFLVFVHPASWRKPPSERSKTKDIWKLLTKDNQLLYLEIHSTEDGMKVFNAGTRYDFYCMMKSKNFKNTIIIDEIGNKVDINLSNWNFLPNYNIDKISKLLGTGCEIIFSRSLYASDRPGISDVEDDIFKYKLVHSTPKSGIRYMFADKNKGHFGVSKVIFGERGINDVIIDINGDYGITNSSMGIKVYSSNDAILLKEYLMGDFQEIIKGCMWGNFRIDWRLFTFFRKDFWK